jgi:hypothetical protein
LDDEDDALVLARLFYAALEATPRSMVIGAPETRQTSLDGEFDLIALAELAVLFLQDGSRRKP